MRVVNTHLIFVTDYISCDVRNITLACIKIMFLIAHTRSSSKVDIIYYNRMYVRNHFFAAGAFGFGFGFAAGAFGFVFGAGFGALAFGRAAPPL